MLFPVVTPELTDRNRAHLMALTNAESREAFLTYLRGGSFEGNPQAAATYLANCASLEDVERLKWVEHQIQLARSTGVAVASILDSHYPAELMKLEDPPTILFASAIASALPFVRRPRIAIVGTRGATEYGRTFAFKLARDLTCRGVDIVSGFARGIDAASHRGAIDGVAIPVFAENTPHADRPHCGFAVLGSGVATLYPADHRQLADVFLQNGGVFISEYGCSAAPLQHQFPARNRIIAALSDAVVVIEAPQRSGALITARVARDIGVEVFAVPGRVDADNCVGSNALLRDGAHPLLDLSDLEPVLGMLTAKRESAKRIRRAKLEVAAGDQTDVVQILGKSGAVSRDALSSALVLPPGRLASALSELEVLGVVSCSEGDVWSLLKD